MENFSLEKLQQQIKECVTDLTGISVIPDMNQSSRSEFGDYSTNVAMVLSKQLSPELKKSFVSPVDLAEELVVQLKQKISQEDIEVITAMKPGFINFTLAKPVLLKHLEMLVSKSIDELVINKERVGRKAIVEYSSPNIAKPFTIGHLRSTIIGNAVANILTATGYTVFRDNHLGDWGTQFGKQIYAFLNIPLDPTGEKSNEEILNSSEHPVKDLVQLYIEFHTQAEQKPEMEEAAREWFKRLEDGDKEARAIWKKCIDWSLKEFKSIYDQLGVSFTENGGLGYGESYFEDKMGPVLEELTKKNLLTDSNGARLVFLEEEKLPPLMIIKKDGATLYATRDLATDKFRKDNVKRYGTDPLIINEVGGEQSEYFQQLFAVEKRLGWFSPGQRVHVKHGHFRFQDKKMSTRKGNVIWLSDVIAEAVTRAKGNSVIGLGALKWNDLKRSAHLDVVFDWDEILSMDGNSGPYMQYAYTRCVSILRKAEVIDITSLAAVLAGLDQSKIGQPELELLRKMSKYPQAVSMAAAEFAPHHLSTYLFELAQHFNTFYHQCPVLQATGQEKELRLALIAGVAETIRHGLGLLGIGTLEQM